MKPIWEDKDFFIEQEPHELPWIKLFCKTAYKELSDMPPPLRAHMWRIYDIAEETMRRYYNPEKINMASFGNMLPQVHIHIMARFKNDGYFPNPLWGERLRDTHPQLPSFDGFAEALRANLSRRLYKKEK